MVIIVKKNSLDFTATLFERGDALFDAHGETPAEATETVLDELEYMLDEAVELLKQHGRVSVKPRGQSWVNSVLENSNG